MLIHSDNAPFVFAIHWSERAATNAVATIKRETDLMIAAAKFAGVYRRQVKK